jgi:hypothetical protein
LRPKAKNGKSRAPFLVAINHLGTMPLIALDMEYNKSIGVYARSDFNEIVAISKQI